MWVGWMRSDAGGRDWWGGTKGSMEAVLYLHLRGQKHAGSRAKVRFLRVFGS
jgi:hypothetical protein